MNFPKNDFSILLCLGATPFLIVGANFFDSFILDWTPYSEAFLFGGLSLAKSRLQDFAHSRHLIDTVFAQQIQMQSPHTILLGFDKPR